MPNIGLNSAYLIFGIFAIIGGLTVIFLATETRGQVLETLSPSLGVTPSPATVAAKRAAPRD